MSNICINKASFFLFVCIIFVTLNGCSKSYKIKEDKIYYGREIASSQKVVIDDVTYFTDEEGKIKRNQFIDINDRTCNYCDEKGQIVRNRWVTIEGSRFYFDINGQILPDGIYIIYPDVVGQILPDGSIQTIYSLDKHTIPGIVINDLYLFKNGTLMRGRRCFPIHSKGRVGRMESIEGHGILFNDGVGQEQEWKEDMYIIKAYQEYSDVEREFIVYKGTILYNDDSEPFYQVSDDGYYLDENNKIIKCESRELEVEDIINIPLKIRLDYRVRATDYTSPKEYRHYDICPLIADTTSNRYIIDDMTFDMEIDSEDKIEFKDVKINKYIIPFDLYENNPDIYQKYFRSERNLDIKHIITSEELIVKNIHDIKGKYFFKPGEKNEIINKKFEDAFSYKSLNEYDEFATIDDIQSIKLGSYRNRQTGNKYNQKFDLEWIILDKSDEELMLLSKYTFDYEHPFGNFELDNKEPYKESEIPWKETNVRDFLNHEFYDNAFSEEEKKRIIVKNDRVSLLSSEEYNKYFIDKEKGKTRGYMQDKYDKTFDFFELRDPLIYKYPNNVSSGRHLGKAVKCGEVVENGVYLGGVHCRPVIYVKIK